MCRTSGNLCLSFSMSMCNDASVNSSIEAPKVTVFMKTTHNDNGHIVVILGAVGGVILALCIVSLSVFLYIKNKDSEVRYTESKGRNLHHFHQYICRVLMRIFYLSFYFGILMNLSRNGYEGLESCKVIFL